MNFWQRSIGLASVCLAVWGAPVGAMAAAPTVLAMPMVGGVSTVKPWQTATTVKKKKVRKPKVVRQTTRLGQPVERSPSGESLDHRERRLLRECRGRPNAGACLGYAS